MHIRVTVITAFLLICSTALATGWSDYELVIDPGYSIVRANSLDVLLTHVDGPVLVSPRDHPDVGPIVEYAVTNTHIFTRHMGRKPRNHFAGDTFEELDHSQEFFFTVRKGTNQVAGPLTQAQFQTQPEVASATINWNAPQNPNAGRFTLDDLIFLAFFGGLLVGMVFILLWLIILPLRLVLWYRRKLTPL